MPYYAGGTLINTTFVGDTRANIVSNIITQLLAAGWTSVWGTGTNQILRSAATPNGNSIDLHCYDPGSGDANFYIQNASGSKYTSIPIQLMPTAARTFRIVANKYVVACWGVGTTLAREFLIAGTVFTPDFLAASLMGNLGFIQGQGYGTFTTQAPSFRNDTTTGGGYSTQAILINDSVTEGHGWTAGQALAQKAPQPYAPTVQQWYDGSRFVNDAELAVIPAAMPLVSIGYLPGCIVIGEAFADGMVINYDGHTWQGITVFAQVAAGGTGLKGTLFFCVS